MDCDKEKYPLFSGRIKAVAVIAQLRDEQMTVCHYLTSKDQSELEKIAAEGNRDKAEEELKRLLKRVTIPFRLDPSVVLEADVRTIIDESTDGEYGEGESVPAYRLDVIDSPNPRYKGLKYLLFLVDDEED